MKRPQAFRDFVLHFNQDIDPVQPIFGADGPSSRIDIYKSFRRNYGDEAICELNAFIEKLMSNEHVDLEEYWLNEAKAGWVISNEGIRRLFKDFQAWASSHK